MSSRWTPEAAEAARQRGLASRPGYTPTTAPKNPRPPQGGSGTAAARGNTDLALGRMKTGKMNKTEAAYSNHLETMKRAGQVAWYLFDGIKLRLADNTFLTVDFAVMLADGQLEMHEVKGFYRDDAKVKMKVAADKFPFRFLLIRAKAKKDGGGWDIEECR